ncbi:MAG: response regulator [Candidatus Magasanikbacteria bacterium]|nr:response regulator [Candidatus Magasanikbacteria bacterium]
MIKKNKKKLILLSDLDPILTRFYKFKFEKLKNWKSIIAKSYPKALKQIEKEKPQIVISDIILKQGNGFKLIKKIRKSKNKKISKIPIIILTDLSQLSDSKKAKKLGATEYLIKNEVSLNDVIKKIEDL